MDDSIHSTGPNCYLAHSNGIAIAAAPMEMEQVNLLMFIKYACLCGYITLGPVAT